LHVPSEKVRSGALHLLRVLVPRLVLVAREVSHSLIRNVVKLMQERLLEQGLGLLEHGRIRMLSGVVPCSSWASIRVGLVRVVLTSSMTRLLRLVLAVLSVLPIRRMDGNSKIKVGVVN
jgi:hypothetical protein